MALVLTIYEDEPFYVGDIPVHLCEIMAANKFKLRVSKNGMEEIHTVTDKMSIEVLPNVKVSAGHGSPSYKGKGKLSVKVLIDAPKNIKILREKLYKESNGGTSGGNH